MNRPTGVPLVALILGGVLLAGLGGVAVLGDDGPAAAMTTPTGKPGAKAGGKVASKAPKAPKAPATKAPPAPGSLAAYALDADKVCNAAFAASKPVDLDRQALTQVLEDRALSAALEVRTASQLLALVRPADAKAARVPAVLTAHRAAYAAVTAAARPDGRALQVRAKALVEVENRPKATSVASGAVFLGLGSKRCAAWLNPSLLRDTDAN